MGLITPFICSRLAHCASPTLSSVATNQSCATTSAAKVKPSTEFGYVRFRYLSADCLSQRTKRKQKKGTKSSTTLAGPEVRKSTRSSTRRNYKEEQSPAPSSDPELESDVGKKHFRCADCQFEEPRPIKRSRRGQGAGPSSRVKATKTESAGRASSSKKRKVSEGRTRLRQRSALTSDDLDMLRFLSPEPAKPSLSTIRPKSQRNHKK